MKTRVCPIYFVQDCIIDKCALIQLSVLLLECHLLLIKNITIKKQGLFIGAPTSLCSA